MKFIDDVIEKPQKYNISSEGKLILSKHKDNLIKEVKDNWGNCQIFGFNSNV